MAKTWNDVNAYVMPSVGLVGTTGAPGHFDALAMLGRDPHGAFTEKLLAFLQATPCSGCAAGQTFWEGE